MSFVEVRHFSYSYPGAEEPVLYDINLTINQGDFVVITGKSGCGKSTLGNALAGFLFQSSTSNFQGKIIINQADMTQLPLFEAIEKVAFVQQNPEDQFCTLTVMDEIAFGLENMCMEPEVIEQRIYQALVAVNGLDLEGRELSSLSGGEKQKVAIASMLALLPDVLILDEPTSNLDPVATQTIFQTLYDLRQSQNLTVIIIEHKLKHLVPFSPIIYRIDQGRLNSEKIDESSLRFDPIKSTGEFSEPPKFPIKTSPLIDLHNINIDLQGHHILQNINVSVSKGEFISLMGPNGSGKSTLLRTLMGLHKPSSGTGTIFNQDIDQIKTSALVEMVGFIFQNPDHQLFTQSVWEELIFTVKNLGIFSDIIDHDANKLLAMMNLSNRKNDHPQRLSYGEKRRLNLASVILHAPKLLLIDELLIGQDLENARIWMSFLLSYTKEGNSVIMVNHLSDLTWQYCDRILFMDEGNLIIDSPISEVSQKISQSGYQIFLPVTEQEFVYA